MALNKKAQYIMNQFSQNPDLGELRAAIHQYLVNMIESPAILSGSIIVLYT